MKTRNTVRLAAALLSLCVTTAILFGVDVLASRGNDDSQNAQAPSATALAR